MSTGARFRSTGTARKLSDNVELPKNYPNLTANGDLKTSGDTLASVQNLPAVLTDPRKGIISNISFSFVSISFGIILRVFNIIFCIKNRFYFVGKQRDFFTRTWGEDFTENQAIPPSPYVCQLSVAHCEKYLKKLRKYCPRHAQGGQHRGHVQSRS